MKHRKDPDQEMWEKADADKIAELMKILAKQWDDWIEKNPDYLLGEKK